jgi:hypothetical protein
MELKRSSVYFDVDLTAAPAADVVRKIPVVRAASLFFNHHVHFLFTLDLATIAS